MTHELFAELIVFWGGLSPSLYADEVLRAASWAAIPPIYYSGGAKHENDKTLYKCMKRVYDATGPQKLSSRSNESSIFMFFIIIAKKNSKTNVNENCQN